MRRRCVVIKVSGAAFEQQGSDKYVRDLASVVADASNYLSVAITIGGGGTARRYIQRALALGLDPVRASHLGGDVGLMNGRIFLGALTSAGANAGPDPVMSFSEALMQLNLRQVAILYGYWPGLTSDSVATNFAGYCRADLIVKLSRTAGVFDADPVLNPDAALITRMTANELVELAIGADSRAPGASFVVDLVAAKSVAITSIPLMIAHWSDTASIRKALEGSDGPLALPSDSCTVVLP